MKKTTSASIGLVLLLAYGCGPGNTFSPPSLISPVEAPVTNKLLCSPIETHSVSDADKTVVVLDKELVDSVLNELGSKSFDLTTFWRDLSDESRDKLNFSINASIKKSRPANYQTIYQATAMFMTRILGSYQQGYDYRIKDISGKVVSFVNPNARNPMVLDMASTCDLDLSFIKLPSSIVMPNEVSKLVICRFTENRQFSLMQARGSYLLMSESRLARAKATEGRLTDSSTKLKIKIEAPEFKLNMNMKKNSEMILDGRVSNKTSVDLSIPDMDVKENGACHVL